jgi:alkanesulfonate monooxygenase SsuD/methylene tetrahydromethanopterin reductase-like flavin-dependent oxidoreductase (luciferase family)
LANTRSLIVASGIANIYARDPFASAAVQKGLNEQSGGRFLLGLGVSHAYFVEGLRRLEYGWRERRGGRAAAGIVEAGVRNEPCPRPGAGSSRS